VSELEPPPTAPTESAVRTLLWAALRLLGIVLATLAAIAVLLLITCYGLAFISGTRL
jgi:hypothetical protein